MSTFVEYRPPHPLPKVGEGFEHATLDLKERANLDKSAHLAKDVAAFANHMGGVLIIGAQEGEGGDVGNYIPLTESELKDTQNAISRAVAQRCSPRPVIDFGHYEQADGGYILTVLVWPFIGQPVGVKVKSNKSSGGFGGDSYFFPVRSGSDTIELTPEQLPMYMLPELRKLAIILGQAKHHDPVMLHTFTTVPRAAYQTSFISVDMLSNRLTVLRAKQEGNPSKAHIPLDAILSAWMAGDGVHVVLNGSINTKNEYVWRERTV